MPNLDKTGPVGQGPRTGRGFGHCGGVLKRGWGCRGCCCCGSIFGKRLSTQDKLAELEDQEKMLEKELSLIKEEKDSLVSLKE